MFEILELVIVDIQGLWWLILDFEFPVKFKYYLAELCHPQIWQQIAKSITGPYSKQFEVVQWQVR